MVKNKTGTVESVEKAKELNNKINAKKNAK